ncbi:MAG TPA: CapA family protein [Candidatus Pullichristensenella stercorigallinarum]|uniref:CapA family protein n=1 Tax=Candidatus Pullichristensenella stercorigallinarum TaxID=2840909 RepID=A0A9D0ZMJ5_9FIRM|nr:CapA family protein [Candidatus Pullichristensenella stercorigallinarum]
MAKKKKNGLHIGSYVIRPLGLAVIGILLVALIVVGALIVFRSIGVSGPDTSEPEPTRQVITLTPTPTATVAATPTVTVEPSPTPSPTPSLRSATIRSLGEIVVEQNVLSSARTETSYDFTPMFEMISDVVGNADYTVGDVEGPMDNRADSAYSGSNPFNTPPQIMLAMKAAGVDMLTLANGQSLDMLFDGLQQTISNCKTAEMEYIGAFASQEEFDTPKIIEINGINVGFLNYTTDLGGMEEQASTNALTYGVATNTNTNPAEDVQAAREAGADVVIAYISWGDVGVRSLGDDDYNTAMALTRAGVDVIVGYHPHTVIAPRWLEAQTEDGSTQRTLCLCATGNFLSDQRDRYTSNGIIFEFTIQETSAGEFEITNPVYIPTYVWRYDAEDGDGYEYRVLAVGEWLENRPEGMSDDEFNHLQMVWNDIQETMSQGNVNATVSAN